MDSDALFKDGKQNSWAYARLKSTTIFALTGLLHKEQLDMKQEGK